MGIVTETLGREIHNRKAHFVFPSEAAADLWSQQVCVLGIVRSAARNRFLAWDRFKEETIRDERRDRRPASSLIRKLFAESLAAKNAAAGKNNIAGVPGLPFNVIIPREFMDELSTYVSSIAALLPSLTLWEDLRNNPRYVPSAEDAAEDRDLEILKEEYAAFLASHDLFEPSWERPSFKDSGREYYIFFPEAMEDFGEYKKVLANNGSIHLVHTEKPEARGTVRRFGSVRGEIRSLLLELRRLHEEEGIAWEAMAVNVPELETLDPYLLREFSLYNIPFRRRFGRPLGSCGAGRLFSLINACAEDHFSFSSLKSLLLDDQLPWRNSLANKSLIEFGIENNCVSSYPENGRFVDIWKEAFEAAGDGKKSLANYYRGLRKSMLAISGAENFADIRKYYFAFRGSPWGKTGEEGTGSGYLDREKCPEENNNVLSRCVEELTTLVKLEQDYPDLKPQKPFRFFLSLLNDIRYVPQQGGTGVNIFPYRVAAAAPFRCHFILNASQDAASVIYRPLKFFRQDKRGRLYIHDYDASGDFFSLYKSEVPGSHLIISASDETVSGPAIPHSWFVGGIEKTEAPDKDPFPEESAWWSEGAGSPRGEVPFPQGIFPVQKQGFTRWHSRMCGRGPGGSGAAFNMLASPFPEAEPVTAMIKEKILRVQWNRVRPGEEGTPRLRISATDLNDFFKCPLLWYYKKIFGVRPYSLEAELLDDKSMGLLYHEILKNLFIRIKNDGPCFKGEGLEDYKKWALECTLDAAKNYQAFKGPLAAPLIGAQAKAISKKIARLLDMEKEYFSDYSVSALEEKFSGALELKTGPAVLFGIIDRVSVSPGGEPVIIDYKTGETPTKAQSMKLADKEIENYQIPFYVRLYEMTHKNIQVEGAFFISINKNELTAVIGKPGNKRGAGREEFQATGDALNESMETFAAALASPDFSRMEKQYKTCAACEYKKICRTTYSLNAPALGNGDDDNE
jgi:RecB family exonuclease